VYFIDVVAENSFGLVDGRAGVADAGGVGDATVEIGPEHGVLGAVGFVGHHQNVRAGIQFREGLGQIGFAELVNHGHDQIRRIRAQQFLEPSDAVGHFDRKADASAGLGKLAFQLGAVGHKDHFPVGEPGMTIHLPNHEHHSQRFAGALGVPDNAAALARVLPRQQTLHRQLDGAELLVAPHDLDGLALVVGRKQGERADEIQQIVAVEHPCDQALLIVGAAPTVGQIVHCAGIGIGPAVKVFLTIGRDRAELGLLAAGGNEDLVVIKERCTALSLRTALLAVTKQLIDGFGDGVFDLG